MRIRTIKPEFWRSADITALERDDRLLFVGLWSYVDDNGVGRDDLAAIIAELFAADMLADPRETVARVTRGLSNLAEASLITRYRVDGREYLTVTGWTRHQRIDKPGKPRYPGPDQGIPTPPRPLLESSRDPRETLAPGTGEQGNRGTEEQRRKDSPDLRPGTTSTEVALVTPNHSPAARGRAKSYPADFESFWHTYPRRDDKADAFKAWQIATRQTPAEQITAGAARYRDDPNREDAFTKYPATWLRAGSWDNGPLPQRRPQSQQDRLIDNTRQTLADLHRMGVA